MGNGVNNYTTNILLKQETLYVQLSSSVLREELSYGKEKIITMLNEHLGKELIKKNSFKLNIYSIKSFLLLKSILQLDEVLNRLFL